MSTLIKLIHNGQRAGTCNAKCYNSRSKSCNCICNGLNHGKGYTEAVNSTRLAGRDAVAAYVAAHPEAATWKIYITLPKANHYQPMLF